MSYIRPIDNNMFAITGTIDKKFPQKEVSIGRFYRTFWLKTHEHNPQYIRMQLSGDRCAELDSVENQDRVIVNFSISGRPKTKDGRDELYNNINVISIVPAEN